MYGAKSGALVAVSDVLDVGIDFDRERRDLLVCLFSEQPDEENL